MISEKISNNGVVTDQYHTSIYDGANLMKKHTMGNVIIIDDAKNLQ